MQRSTDNVYGGYVDGSNNGLPAVVPSTPHVYHLDALLPEHGKRILDSDHLTPSRVFRLWLGLRFGLRFRWGRVTSPFLRGSFLRASQCLARRLDRASLRLLDRIVFLHHLGNLLLLIATGGIVTQFNVKVDAPEALETVAEAIDAEFAADQEPTSTHPEKAFVARAASDVLEIVSFASWLGWGALAAVFALVANAIVLAVQERVRDHAVLQTLGYSGSLIGQLIIAEGVVMGLAGGLVGAVTSWFIVGRGRFSMSMEGMNVEIASDPTVILIGLGLSVALGVLAGLVPAWQASRHEIAACFRAV